MIYLIILQIFSAQIDSAITFYHDAHYEKAYQSAFGIPVDSAQGLEYYEIHELRAYLSTKVRKFNQADSLFQIAFQTTNKDLLRKAYTNYAELQHLQFNFDQRLIYLQMAYDIEQKPQLIRIIARHHFQIRADYETAQLWIDRHPSEMDDKNKAGFNLLLAEFHESKRQYGQAIHHYTQAKISASRANLFNYELFAAEGLYRSEKLNKQAEQEKMINTAITLIFVVGYLIYLMEKYASPRSRKDKFSR